MKGLVYFIAGAAVGVAATWLIMSKKYDEKMEEEINSVKEHFSKMEKEVKEKKEEPVTYSRDTMTNKEPVDSYIRKLKDEGYTKGEQMDKPYIISQDEFAEYDDYSRSTLNYYSNGIVTDATDPDIPLDDVDEILGFENLKEGEIDDWVYIRNDRLKSDYEVYVFSEPFVYED